jgi:hypothetical protein
VLADAPPLRLAWMRFLIGGLTYLDHHVALAPGSTLTRRAGAR